MSDRVLGTEPLEDIKDRIKYALEDIQIQRLKLQAREDGIKEAKKIIEEYEYNVMKRK